jgi:hypothetical protein
MNQTKSTHHVIGIYGNIIMSSVIENNVLSWVFVFLSVISLIFYAIEMNKISKNGK